MKFAVLSDTHYLSETMLLEGASKEARLKNLIPRAVFKNLAQTDAFDTILITGDLTHAGDAASHREYIEMLRGVQKSGKRVLVLTATHDFQFSRAFAVKEGWRVRYKEQPWRKAWFDPEGFDFRRIVQEPSADLTDEACRPPLVKPLYPEELWEAYREFGRDQAFSVFAPDYSYCVKLEEKTWVLMLNNNFRDIDPMENMSASYSPGCLRWIEGIARQAKTEGAFVFACTHHPLLPPVPAYKLGGGDRNMRRAYVGHMLADIGIPLVFSGHTHFADVGFLQSDAGNVLCDVTTPGLCSLPPAYRVAQLDGAKDRLTLTTVPVEKDPSFDIPDKTLTAFYERRFFEEYEEKIGRLPMGLGRVVMGMRAKHVYPLARSAKLSRAEYNAVKETRVFDILMNCAVNMQKGDGGYTPDTPVYRLMLGLAAAADSMIDALPVADLRKKLLGYTVTEIVEPMLCNTAAVPDNNGEFAFGVLPPKKTETPVLRSRAGDVMLVVLSVLAAALSPLSPAVTAAAIPTLSLLKKRNGKKRPPRPERY